MDLFQTIELLSKSSNAVINPSTMLDNFLKGVFSAALIGGGFCLFRFLKSDPTDKKAKKPDMQPSKVCSNGTECSSIEYAAKKIVCECTACLCLSQGNSERIAMLVYSKIRRGIDEKDFSPYRIEQAAWRAIKEVLLDEDAEENQNAIDVCNSHIEDVEET